MRHVLARVRGAAIAAALVASLAVTGIEPTASFAASLDDPDSVSSGAASPDATRSASATSDDTPPAVGQAEADTPQASTVPLGGGDQAATAAASAPTISTDLADYPPGGAVTLTGTGWQPGEIVAIVVNDTGGASWSLTREVTADGGGFISLVFTLPSHYVPNYDVTATGVHSGTATTTFTDANIANGPWRYWMSAVNPTTGTQVTPGTTITYVLNSQRISGGTNNTVAGAVVFLSVSGSATITSVTGAGGNNGSAAWSGSSLTWSNMVLSATTTRSITVTVTVNADAAGAQSIVSSVNDGNDDNGTFYSGGSRYQTVTHTIPTLALSCTQGTFYTVAGDGRLYEVTSSGSTPSATTTPIGASPVWNASGVNGLAITPGGTAAYAFSRGATTVDILRYDPATGTGATLVSGYSVRPATPNYMVAGAVNPVNGMYYFGGYSAANTNRFQVFVFNPATNSITQRGYIVPNGASGIGNSDILFDSRGNLYLSYSTSGTHLLVTVTAANLAAGTSGQRNQLTTNSPALTLATPSTTYNGIAFDSSGRLFAQDADADGTVTSVRTIDPSTGLTLGGPTTLSLSGTSGVGTDLASCLYPGTISVQKNLPNGRAATGNQFGLSISRGGTAQATATTSGSATGIQPQVAGPAIGVTDAVYTITETASGGTVLSNYTSTYQCLVDGTTTVVATGSGTTLNYTFPAPQSGAAAGPDILCTFTNIPITPATVTISKTIQDVNGINPQPGSGWTMGASLGTGTTSGTTISTPATKPTGTNGVVATPWSITFPSGTATANVVISETAQTGYTFVSGSCTITPQTGSPTTVTLNAVSATITGVTPGAAVACTFTNRQQAGTATWQKADATSGSALGGSTWTLTGPGVPADTIVSDCTASPCSTGLYSDTDPAAGGFQLAGLAWGSYTIQEQSAPAGYQLSTTPRTFTISASSLAPTVTGSPFANVRILGAVTWTKVARDAANTPLDGSEWLIVGPAPATTQRAVTDCVAASDAQCTGDDKDARAGYFRVTGLAWGSYSLVETKAPAGYLLDTQPHPFTIGASALTASVGQIVNEQQDVPALPLTGGLGRDWFVLGGGVAMIVALGILFWRRRQSRISP